MATASNEFKLIGPRRREKYNPSAVTLSCRLSPEISAVNMDIRWFKGTDCVCVYKNSQVTEGTGYEGRVSLVTRELETGNVSLHLNDCTWLDSGDYLCQVTDGVRTEEITVWMGPLRWTPRFSHPLQEGVKVQQCDREWTEDKRIKMEKSLFLIEYTMDELKNKIRKLEETEEELKTTKSELEKMSKDHQEKERALHERDQQLQLNNIQMQEAQIQVEETKKTLVEKEKELSEKNQELKDLKEHLEMNEKILTEKNIVLMKTRKKLQNTTEQINEKSIQLEKMNKLLSEKDAQKMELTDKNKQLEEIETLLMERETQLMERDKQLQEKDRLLEEKSKQLQEQTDPESSAPIRRTNSKEGLPPFMGGESSRPLSPVSVPVSELRLVLLGRTRSGKTSTRNTILGREERKQAATSTATSPSPQQSDSTQGDVSGRKVSVVDTPDWFSPGLSLEKLRQDVELCVHLSAPGPHAFLLVIPLKQPTGDERGIQEKMEETFGERCWRNTMIIFSVTDELQKEIFKEFIQSGNQAIQRLVEKCERRFHCLNIKESGDGSQVSELLEKIEKMVEGSREKFYSSEIYLETESQIRAMETKILKEHEETWMTAENELRGKIEKEMQESLGKTEGAIQEQKTIIIKHNERITELERKINEEREKEKRRELERELKQEVEQRMEVEQKVKKLTEERERNKREMEERHQREMEKIKRAYEEEFTMKMINFRKMFKPALQRFMSDREIKMQEEFRKLNKEKDRKIETLRNKLFKIRESLLSLKK